MIEIGNSAPGAFLVWKSEGTALTTLSGGNNPISFDTLYSVPAEVGRKLDKYAFTSDTPILSSSKFLIQGERHRPILVDAGSGNGALQTPGSLRESLNMAGVKPEEIGLVILADLHPEHCGRLVDYDGKALYPNAKLVVNKAEASFWLAKERELALQGNLQQLFEQVKTSLAPYRDRLDVFQSGELAPGLTAIPLPGRYPWLTGFLLEAGPEKVFFWSDPADRPMAQRGWAASGIVYDTDRMAISSSRKRTSADADDRRMLACGSLSEGTATALTDRHGDFCWLAKQPWLPHRTG